MENSAKTRPGANAYNNTTDQNTGNKADGGGTQQEELTREIVEGLLETEAKLRETIDERQEEKKQCRIREKMLTSSNSRIEMDNANIRKLTDELDKEILALSEKSEKEHDELENYKAKNRQEAEDFWAYFQAETAKYSHLLPNAHIEYSSNCLEQDIQIYHQKAKTLRDKIARVEKQMESIIANDGLAEIGTSKDAKILEDFEVAKKIISDKSSLLRATKLEAEKNDVIQLTIKQKKHDIEYINKKLSKSRGKY